MFSLRQTYIHRTWSRLAIRRFENDAFRLENIFQFQSNDSIEMAHLHDASPSETLRRSSPLRGIRDPMRVTSLEQEGAATEVEHKPGISETGIKIFSSGSPSLGVDQEGRRIPDASSALINGCSGGCQAEEN